MHLGTQYNHEIAFTDLSLPGSETEPKTAGVPKSQVAWVSVLLLMKQASRRRRQRAPDSGNEHFLRPKATFSGIREALGCRGGSQVSYYPQHQRHGHQQRPHTRLIAEGGGGENNGGFPFKDMLPLYFLVDFGHMHFYGLSLMHTYGWLISTS